MKKTFVIIALIGFVAVGQEYRFPGWSCTDASLFAQQLPLAPTPQTKTEVAIMVAMLQSPPADYAAARDIIDAAIGQHYAGCTPEIRLVMRKKIALVTRRWEQELIAYCIAHPCPYDIQVATRLKNPWATQRLQECLLADVSRDPGIVSAALTALTNCAVRGDITPEETKAVLQKIDLLFTDKLSLDKEKWTPVVAKIRTILERY